MSLPGRGLASESESESSLFELSSFSSLESEGFLGFESSAGLMQNWNCVDSLLLDRPSFQMQIYIYACTPRNLIMGILYEYNMM